MRKSELDRLLESAVADALGLAPRRTHKPRLTKPVPRVVRHPSYAVEQHAAH
jgi:hypothetical protein